MEEGIPLLIYGIKEIKLEYTSLYRRFRPKTFSEILGQEHITTTLKNQVINNRVGHAYLFTGSRGCGKTSSAKVLARAVNCLNPKDGEPCNECEICKAALDGSLTDIVELDAASNNGVDNIRSIIEQVNFLPVTAKYRIYIIDEVHMLSTGAFNALLKTLEEPPSHVKFILCTTDPQKIPATIISRCLRFDFKKISTEYIVENLETICKDCKIEYTEDSLELIAELADGAMRDALSILERCAQDGENHIDSEKIKKLAGIPEMEYIINMVEAIADYDTDKVIELCEKINREGTVSNNFLWQIVKFIKDVLIVKSTGEYSNIYSSSEKDRMKTIAQKVEKQRLLSLIYAISKLENDLKWATQKDIVFEAGMINLAMVVEEKQETVKVAPKKVEIKKETIGEKPKEEPKVETKKEESKIEAKTETIETKPTKKEPSITTETKLKNEIVLDKIIEKLPSDGSYTMLRNGLANSKAYRIDDLNVGILTTQTSEVFMNIALGNPEVEHKLKELISAECGQVMKVKLVKKGGAKSKKEDTKSGGIADLGIPINEIDE